MKKSKKVITIKVRIVVTSREEGRCCHCLTEVYFLSLVVKTFLLCGFPVLCYILKLKRFSTNDVSFKT